MGMEFSIKRMLVTGGCGFIGANFIRLELEVDPDISITNLDGLTYAGNPDNLADLSGNPRYRLKSLKGKEKRKRVGKMVQK